MKRKRQIKRLTPWLQRRCLWCDNLFMCVQSRRAICSTWCHTQRSRFRKMTGFYPISAPGKVTARKAFDALVRVLLEVERARLSEVPDDS